MLPRLTSSNTPTALRSSPSIRLAPRQRAPISVVNLSSFTVTGSISTGLHPTGMALWGKNLLVANTYNDTISVIDTSSNQVTQTINLGCRSRCPYTVDQLYGVGPNSIAVDQVNNIAYVALYNANAIAVVELANPFPVLGMIPVGYAPSSVVLDTTDNVLLVANDKGIGTTGIPGRKFADERPWRDRLQHPPGPWHRQHRSRAADLGNLCGADRAGLPEQPLGSVRKASSSATGGNPSTPRRSRSRRRSAIRRRSSTCS